MSTHFVQHGRVIPTTDVHHHPGYTTAEIGGNRVNLDRYVDTVGEPGDGKGAIPVGEHRDHLPGMRGVKLAEDDVIEFFRAQELYVTRTQSHLFEDWMVDLVLDLAYTAARNSGHMLADCHRCRITLAVSEDTDDCTYCGTEF